MAEAGIALGFRRLSILDLSPAGQQPMRSADGNLVMVFNGEIYNHHELRAALEAESTARWRGHSDSEVLIEAIARWGLVAALERLNGMFAIVVWDRRTRRLALARDRFGEKPLYYGWIGGVLLLASELKALPPHPVLDRRRSTAPRSASISRYGYVPAPCTAYAGMRKLPPGAYLEIAADRRDGVPRALLVGAGARRRGGGGAVPRHARRRRRLVAGADRRRGRVADGGRRAARRVPVGRDRQLDDRRRDAARARRRACAASASAFPMAASMKRRMRPLVARHLGTEHTTLEASETECLDILPRVAEIYDEPFADASQLPTLRALPPDARARYGRPVGRRRRRIVRRLRPLCAAPPRPGGGLTRSPPALKGAARAAAALARRPRLAPGAAPAQARRGLAHATPESLYRDHLSALAPGRRAGARPRRAARPRTMRALDAGLPSLEQRFMLRDAMTYLPDDLLVKVDRASMACGLEVRAPLLDHRIAEFAWSLPPPSSLQAEPSGCCARRSIAACRGAGRPAEARVRAAARALAHAEGCVRGPTIC